MKIGINLVGVSYNDGYGRYRNYEDAIDGFMNNIVNPLKSLGHEITFYLYSYYNKKELEIIESYKPKKYVFTHPNLNKLGGGDKLPNGIKVISQSYINSLEQMIDEDLDLIISTRFDINFLKNPFESYPFEFTKFNFLWREPEYTDLPIVNDTFVVFPYSMLNNVINSIKEMEHNPPHGVNVAMHNWYLPMVNQVGEKNVKWVSDEFINTINNNLYKLTRHE
jgi:hypothetical protein